MSQFSPSLGGSQPVEPRERTPDLFEQAQAKVGAREGRTAEGYKQAMLEGIVLALCGIGKELQTLNQHKRKI